MRLLPYLVSSVVALSLFHLDKGLKDNQASMLCDAIVSR